ncbi:MAG TPA: hypothetical protein VF017_08195 [Thermoanaerobaculia bacterium]|nr:hypothetical protein [Thermoanaerobaculia bacterium]
MGLLSRLKRKILGLIAGEWVCPNCLYDGAPERDYQRGVFPRCPRCRKPMIQGSKETFEKLATDARTADTCLKAKRLEELLEEYPDEEEIPYSEVIRAAGPEIAAMTNPHLDMTEEELVERVKADPNFKHLTEAERAHALDLPRPMLKKK